MFYCEHCMILCEESECPECGLKELRAPQKNDSVYLMTQDAIWCAGIEEILKENKVIYLKRGTRAVAVSIAMGEMTEKYEFFVPYAEYENAKELLGNFFHEEQ